MPNLILRPSGLPEPNRKWALQLRFHESLGEVEYYNIAFVSEDVAQDIVKAGAPDWLFSKPT